MNQIDGITNDAKQQFFVSIDGYSSVQINLEYSPNQYSWFISLIWGSFSLNNEKLVVGPNILRQFKNQIPFGLAITTTNGVDPIFQDSFSLGYNTFIILSVDDVKEVEAVFYG